MIGRGPWRNWRPDREGPRKLTGSGRRGVTRGGQVTHRPPLQSTLRHETPQTLTSTSNPGESSNPGREAEDETFLEGVKICPVFRSFNSSALWNHRHLRNGAVAL